MKTNNKYKSSFIALVVAGLLASSASQAAVTPNGTGPVNEFDSSNTDATFNVRVKSWRDPAFGDMGWTHHSQWGIVKDVKQNQVVTIKAVTDVAGFHPGMTVWYRGELDTASDNYVIDHFYVQNAQQYKLGATDETTGVDVGNIVMNFIAHGYDRDIDPLVGSLPKAMPRMNGRVDNIPGQLTLKFRALKPGNYMFVVGGVNPDSAIATSTARHPVAVNVKVTGKEKL